MDLGESAMKMADKRVMHEATPWERRREVIYTLMGEHPKIEWVDLSCRVRGNVSENEILTREENRSMTQRALESLRGFDVRTMALCAVQQT